MVYRVALEITPTTLTDLLVETQDALGATLILEDFTDEGDYLSGRAVATAFPVDIKISSTGYVTQTITAEDAGPYSITLVALPPENDKVKELNVNNTTYDIIGKGVVDQNNPSTPLKQWTGTKAQYDAIVSGGTVDSNTIYNITNDSNVGSFANTDLSNLSPTGESVLAGKVDLATGVTQEDVDYVVASQLPTSENDYTWYRLYKSGWIEQGGVYAGTPDNLHTNTLIIEMADTTYQVMISRIVIGTADDPAALSFQARNITTTTFQVRQTFSTKDGNGLGYGNSYRYCWEVKGMSAQGGIS